MGNPDKLIETIKKEKIKPKPKWVFNLNNSLLWLMYFLFVLVGAISFSVILFAIQQTDFELLSHMGHSKLELFLSILPFIWLVLLIVFILGSLYAIYYSQRGYKFTFSRLIAINVGLSVLIGTMFFIGGGASWFENAFAIRTGFYESIQKKKEKVWQNPDKGNLAGVIYDVKDGILEFNDFENKKWIINIDSTFIANPVLLEKGEKIKITGIKIDDTTFKAKEIYPWGGREMQKKMRKRRNKNN
ncbi:MAG TPA: hypothetical protein ENI82_04790 [Bacteroidetes bacterium]|nr:hypothetical protein [Bacteroidota bacterium]